MIGRACAFVFTAIIIIWMVATIVANLLGLGPDTGPWGS